MSWIESHTVLSRHRKLIELSKELRLRKAYIMGHLHSLWHTALEQQEDGDLASWSDCFVADSSDFPGDGPRWVRLLQKYGFLDGKLIHDWLDYAGPYLRNKYGGGGNLNGKLKLEAIWAKHGRVYGATHQRPPSDPQATLPNLPYLTRDNQTNKPNKTYNSGDSSELDLLEMPHPIRGDHFGRRVGDLPYEYCVWAINNIVKISPKLKSALHARIRQKNEERTGRNEH